MSIENFKADLDKICNIHNVVDYIIIVTSVDSNDPEIINLNSITAINDISPYKKQMEGLRRIIVTKNYWGQ